jgi:3-dehydroquinate dehydratase
MTPLDRNQHQLWGTVSGKTFSEVKSAAKLLTTAGVRSLEYRFDLIPQPEWPDVLDQITNEDFVAHFGMAAIEPEREELLKLFGAAIQASAGIIVHSRAEVLKEVVSAACEHNVRYALPYHSQGTLDYSGVLSEYHFQAQYSPLFCKIAIRPLSAENALEYAQALTAARKEIDIPLVAAVFGPQRWARIMMPAVGSAITFIVAKQVSNEAGGDDEQFTIGDVSTLSSLRGIMDR